ncbi:PREDICTED: leucine-rich repeat and WD repeat-containing protein 1 isoform X1 [Poecilia mexicana]|uniref:Leucine-rich repeat and WD repeat-containing protein 1 n=1 Tax=Poecilia mexicana TaxID=48701 RepID=A0A3B3XEI8_9TELE|nr:PREDICTED: leucine-rich repeat and WD repeat-containing protein 1 isoform X1 [Poecilia mexicana]XP_014838692.1 PREDICTED: leucine-rich repeat and WD repeat-containing protein 1 isoform X1 [Poecilia mexicana]
MEKITEKLLLEKGSPKTNKLEQIKTLNLSKMALKLEDLPVKLLSCLKSLERWDLSGNRLQEFPKRLELPALRYLDLSDNQMEDVTTLESLRALEELKMDDNLYITVSDNYKLFVLLPNLRIYNSKDVTATANHLRYVYSDNLRTRMIAVWERSFSLPDPVSAEKLSSLEKNFVSAARQQVKFGPTSVADFTKWRVEILAKEYLRSLAEPKEDSDDEAHTENNDDTDVSEVTDGPDKETSPKRKQTDTAADASISLTPRKKLRADLPESPAESNPRKSSLRLKPLAGTQSRMSPLKPNRGPSTPSKTETKAETPRRSAKVQQVKEAEKKDHLSRKEAKAAQLHRNAHVLPIIKACSKTKPVSLKPLHALQCHSKQDSSDDFSTQLWACAFQPQSESSAGSRLVATCGGDSVCVIDCEMGKVMKKYKVPGEEFFSLAWTTVLMSRGISAPSQPCSILAAGGKRGLVKLIYPRNNMAYGEFRASRKSLSVLRFNHRQGNFLFTGSYDNKIIMWDIGGLDKHCNFKVIQLLTLEVGTTPLHICLPPASPDTHLLTACEDGLFCYNTQLGANSTAKRSNKTEITFPIYKMEDKQQNYHTIDGLSFLTDDVVASKSHTHGSIYLWSWSGTRSQRPDKRSGSVCAVVLAELQWALTDVPYLSLNTCPGRAYIVCGDDKGQIWTYHITNLQKNSGQRGETIPPTEVLEWPTLMRKGLGQIEGPSINSVAMDPELHYLVALTDKNLAVIWKSEVLS